MRRGRNGPLLLDSGLCRTPSEPALLVRSERVADGDSVADRMVRAEFHVVVDEIEMGFGAHKQTVERVDLQAAPYMLHKMVAGDEGRAGRECARSRTLVEAHAFNP